MQNVLFVGGLSFSTEEPGLAQAFASAGTVVSAKVIVDRETGRKKGFGFVTMSSDEEAAKAIQMFDGQELDGRRIRVNIARPREERPARRF
ncbi:MAG: RNP-1 like RNA-binding protein, Glycine-rich [Parcubacteria group bacterium Gr01-1014_18]|nr:MAG: RNP-1 like RNA-binding protein, Glycine-rich [Parcubacteria group bacterium Greene0416_36]TSC79876.1 MAG: RNP-1 like RNA-binding protein, Glycine-rich [Parcubacteria group bacterium Gr01-1014_18]TSC98308.1 MAG: RNP-1 like RNA-binding protein, Glycine-rich [Parcubacteria group bacterium Greene1014_20]TSD06651.1 MAG: RNP-1 like RNA-binding protein, Glycine-rich [Parcubacteria group bacterium Greene0714_2]